MALRQREGTWQGRWGEGPHSSGHPPLSLGTAAGWGGLEDTFGEQARQPRGRGTVRRTPACRRGTGDAHVRPSASALGRLQPCGPRGQALVRGTRQGWKLLLAAFWKEAIQRHCPGPHCPPARPSLCLRPSVHPAPGSHHRATPQASVCPFVHSPTHVCTCSSP